MLSSALQLMRFDKPVGIFLLWWPTAWALWLANPDTLPLMLCLWFALGTVLMRAAGCVINDIADRQIDLHVKRTKNRPLTSGRIGLLQAWGLLLFLLLLAFLVLVQLPRDCFYYALLALALTGTYPFSKRYISSPQTLLALAFSCSIPMVYVASHHALDAGMWLCIGINVLWVLAYDSLYACVDEADDKRIGIHSTALSWGESTLQVVIALELSMQLLWLAVAWFYALPWRFLLAWCLGGAHFYYQYRLVRRGGREAYFQAFQSNVWYGLLMCLGLVLSRGFTFF